VTCTPGDNEDAEDHGASVDGRLADMFGRRRIFFAGATVFAGFSVIEGVAPSAWVLLACRFLMGIGGAMMSPAILSMTYCLLPRAKAGRAA
jgi:DHA2 family multidrug resistance protein-like MFS transporter